MTDPIRIELRAQHRAKQSKGVQVASRPPTDPVNVARLKLWHQRVREYAIRRQQMEAL